MDKIERTNWIKLIEEFDEDFKISDYSPEELDELRYLSNNGKRDLSYLGAN